MNLKIAILLIFFLSCKWIGDNLIEPKLIINGIEIEKKWIQEIEDSTGKKLEPFTNKIYSVDKAYSTVSNVETLPDGFQITRVEKNKAYTIVRENQERFSKLGLYIYMRHLSFDLTTFKVDKKFQMFYDIIIIKATDQFEVVKYEETSGGNYDISNDRVIEQLKKWNQDSPFTIIVADYNGVEADFYKLPKDLNQFAKDIYKFCPDTIEQGSGSEEELVKHFLNEKSFWLWWD
ncbi:MAG: DUF4253 domain-containing protein [Leptospiraceae bacterium]|nr:DUF4253 domain-containing protein [Leptospiraceae bacterium]